MPMKQPSGTRTSLWTEEGIDTSARLERSSVLIVGVGALANPLAAYLTTAGIGRIGIADFATRSPSTSNLSRNESKDRGGSNIESAMELSLDVNSRINLEFHEPPIGSTSTQTVLRDYDVVADATDSLEERYSLNDSCAFVGRPVVHGSVDRFEAHVSVFCSERGPCYRCLFPGAMMRGSGQQGRG